MIRTSTKRSPWRLSGARRLAAAALALVALALGTASAEEWTIQTVAVRDLREAQLIALDLTSLGYDAYTEFAMSDDGLQWTRVRVGCFYGHAGAEAVAELLRSTVTREAVVVERTPTAPARGCLRRLVGFVVPGELIQPEAGVPRFVVDVAGVRGVVRFTEGRWRVMQDHAADALPPGQVGAARYRQVSAGGRPHVRMRHEDGDFYVCAGRLLAEADGAAIVEDGGVVLACLWTDPVVEGDES